MTDTPSPSPSPISIVKQDDIHIIHFKRNIFNEEMLQEVQNELRQLITNTDKPRFVLDMSKVTHASSNFLGMMMDATLKTSHKQGQMRVCQMTAEVKEMFALTRLDKMVAIHQTCQDAIASFEQP